MSIRWTQEEYNAWMQGNSRATVRAADLEPNSIDGPAAKNVDKEVCPRFRIHVHSRRRRLCDPDGVSAKAAIDGLVKSGLLPDDSAQYIDSVTFSQEKALEEETVITIDLIQAELR